MEGIKDDGLNYVDSMFIPGGTYSPQVTYQVMSRRDYFAVTILNGILSDYIGQLRDGEMVENAVTFADQLIIELNKDVK